MDQATKIRTALVETMSVVMIDVEDLEPNPWNPNRMTDEMLGKERASIRKFGFVDPITVRDLANGNAQIIDGEHRWIVARQMGLSIIPAINLGKISDEDAQQLTIVLNDTRGQTDPRRLATLLSDLMKTVSKDSLLETLPYSREAFDQLANLPSLDWDSLPKMPTAPVGHPEAWVERTFRMPKSAAGVLDQAIARARDDMDERTAEWALLEMIAADYLGS